MASNLECHPQRSSASRPLRPTQGNSAWSRLDRLFRKVHASRARKTGLSRNRSRPMRHKLVKPKVSTSLQMLKQRDGELPSLGSGRVVPLQDSICLVASRKCNRPLERTLASWNLNETRLLSPLYQPIGRTQTFLRHLKRHPKITRRLRSPFLQLRSYLSTVLFRHQSTLRPAVVLSSRLARPCLPGLIVPPLHRLPDGLRYRQRRNGTVRRRFAPLLPHMPTISHHLPSLSIPNWPVSPL